MLTKRESETTSPFVQPQKSLVVGLSKEPARAQYGRARPLVATVSLPNPSSIQISGIRSTVGLDRRLSGSSLNRVVFSPLMRRPSESAASSPASQGYSLGGSQLYSVASSQMNSVASSQVYSLASSQINSMVSSQMNSMASSQMNSMASSQFNNMAGNYANSQVGSMTNSQVRSFADNTVGDQTVACGMSSADDSSQSRVGPSPSVSSCPPAEANLSFSPSSTSNTNIIAVQASRYSSCDMVGSQEHAVSGAEEPHSTCSPSPPAPGASEELEPTHSSDASNAATTSDDDFPQLEPVDLSKPGLPKPEGVVDVSNADTASDKLSPVAVTPVRAEVVPEFDVTQASSSSLPMTSTFVNNVKGLEKEEENETSHLTMVTLDQEASTVAAGTDFVLDPSLNLESLLDRAEGKMLTLLATEGPDGSFVILSDASCEAKDQSSSTIEADDLPIGLHEPSLGEQLEAEFRMIKQTLTDSLAKTRSEEDKDAEQAGDQTAGQSLDELTTSMQDDNELDTAGSKLAEFSQPAAGPDFAKVTEEEEAENKTEESELFDDSLTNLERQVSDLVDYMDDPLSDFVKDESVDILADESPPKRKRKRLESLLSSGPAAKEGKLDRDSMDGTADMTETIEIEAELVQLPHNSDAGSSDESPEKKTASWKSCEDEFFSRENSSMDVTEDQDVAESRPARRSLRMMSVSASPAGPDRADSAANSDDNETTELGDETGDQDTYGDDEEESLHLVRKKETRPSRVSLKNVKVKLAGERKKLRLERKLTVPLLRGKESKEKRTRGRQKARVVSSDEEGEDHSDQKTPRPSVKKPSLASADEASPSPGGGRVRRAAAMRAEVKFAQILPSSKQNGDESDISGEDSSGDSRDNFDLGEEVGDSKLYRVCNNSSGTR